MDARDMYTAWWVPMNTTTPESSPTARGAMYMPVVLVISIVVVLIIAGLLYCACCISDPEATDIEATPKPDTKSLNAALPTECYWKWNLANGSGDTILEHTRSSRVCAICLDKIHDQVVVRGLPCKHVFHVDCIDVWFRRGNFSCPLCKRCYYTMKE